MPNTNVVFIGNAESVHNVNNFRSKDIVTNTDATKVATAQVRYQDDPISQFELSLAAETLVALEIAAEEFNQQITQKR